MGKLRASARKVITIPSDAEEDESGGEQEVNPDEDRISGRKPQTATDGKLRPTKKSLKTHSSTSAAATKGPKPAESPQKPAHKGKSVSKEPSKPNAKPIYSFFNAATQKLQSSQTPSASPEKLSNSQNSEEVIQDGPEDGSDSGLQFSKSSNTALALRKRKYQPEGNVVNDEKLPLPASQKFRKASNGDRVPSFSMVNDDKRPWIDQFPPSGLSELGVHNRKVGDVRDRLHFALKGKRQRVLVLKGPAGTGKTATIRLLAREMGVDVQEWRNPLGGDSSVDGTMSTAIQFEQFIARAGTSAVLQFASSEQDVNEYDTKGHQATDNDEIEGKTQLLLVEEFPNTFSRSSSTLQSFRSAIMQYLASPVVPGSKPTPIVMIVSETLLSSNTALADSFTAHRLLGPELSNHPFLEIVEFNPIAPTILLKALELVVLKEARKTGRRRTPGPQVLKRLAESGDIRSAISSLEFLCLRGDGEDIWSSKVTFTKQKKSKADLPLTQAEEEALKLISNREATLDIFHAVGKVVYNKRIAAPDISHPPPWLQQHRRSTVPENEVDRLVDEVGTDTSTFIAALHENYVLSCTTSSKDTTLDSLLGCIDNISDADLLSIDRFSYGTRAFSGSATDSLRQDEMAFNVGVRGLWFSLPIPVHRSAAPNGQKGGAHLMMYPISVRLWRRKEEVEGVLETLMAGLRGGGLVDGLLNEGTVMSGSGVETWKKSNGFEVANVPLSDANLTRTDSVKLEMLLERLPYMSQILSSRKNTSAIIDQLQMVTAVHSLQEDEGEEDDEREDDEHYQEPWTTDHPNLERSGKPRTAKGMSKKARAAFDVGGGLEKQLEPSIDALVLQDDDIED